ncbi:hypothetical protein, partial [Nocardioides deserti]|uniref:hypothetical protein n=1 Tax=Nocardioides deserti TaxID=1588644 RepID=UPI001E33AF4A
MQAQHRLVDDPVQADHADGAGDGGDVLVDVRGDVVGAAEDGLGDPAGAPGGDVAGQGAGPGLRQSVAQHQRVADERLPGFGGHGVRRGERRWCVPAHQWDPGQLVTGHVGVGVV